MSEQSQNQEQVALDAKVSLPLELDALADSVVKRTKRAGNLAKVVQEEQLEREVYRNFGQEYDQRARSYKELYKGYMQFQGKTLLSRWGSKLNEIRRRATYDAKLSGTEVENLLKRDDFTPLSSFAEETGLSITVYTNNVIKIARTGLDRVVDGEVVRFRFIDPLTLDRETKAAELAKDFFDCHREKVASVKGLLERAEQAAIDEYLTESLLSQRSDGKTVSSKRPPVLSARDLAIKNEALERIRNCMLGKVTLEAATSVEPYLLVSKTSSKYKTLKDPESGFIVAYPEEQFEVYWSAAKQEKSSSPSKGQQKSFQTLSYLQLRCKDEYLDQELDENGEKRDIGKAFTGTITEVTDHVKGTTSVQFSSMRYKKIDIAEVATEFNNFYRQELETQGIELDDETAAHSYDIVKEDGLYTLLDHYMARIGLTNARDIPMSSRLDPAMTRADIADLCQDIERNRLSILAEMKDLDVVTAILKCGKYPPQSGSFLRELQTDLKQILRSDPDAIDEYTKSAILASEAAYMSQRAQRSSTPASEAQELRQKAEQVNKYLKVHPLDEEIVKLDVKINEELTAVGRQIMEAERERYQSRNAEESKTRTSYIDAGAGAVTYDVPSVWVDEEFTLDEIESEEFSAPDSSVILPPDVMKQIEALDREIPPEIEGITELDNLSRGRPYESSDWELPPEVHNITELSSLSEDKRQQSKRSNDQQSSRNKRRSKNTRGGDDIGM